MKTEASEIVTYLERQKELSEKATPGPWLDHSWDPFEKPHIIGGAPPDLQHCRGKYDIPQSDSDCFFIVAARESVPKMAEALLQIHKLHTPMHFDELRCSGCSHPAPCPTVRIIESCLGDKP